MRGRGARGEAREARGEEGGVLRVVEDEVRQEDEVELARRVGAERLEERRRRRAPREALRDRFLRQGGAYFERVRGRVRRTLAQASATSGESSAVTLSATFWSRLRTSDASGKSEMTTWGSI